MTAIIKEYGTALFMLAREEGKAKEYAVALEEIKKIFIDNPLYVAMLSSPSIALSERLNAIDEAFKGNAPEDVVSYLKLLCEKGRIIDYNESVAEYQCLLNEYERVFTAKVTSAQELTEDEKTKLIQKLNKAYLGEIKAEYFIDSTLIGGVIVEIDGKVMDGSLRRRLQDVKEVINQ